MIREIINAPLRERNSFGVEASARRIVEFEDAASLRYFFADHTLPSDEKISVLGAGNNILFTGDFPGTLLHPADKSFTIVSRNAKSAVVRVGAGLEWDRFVEECVSRGWWGAENLSAIPGTVGAAPVQNIGAYGAEASDIIESVEVLDLTTLKEAVIVAAHCSFGYRDSIFKNILRNRAVITGVNFRLSKTPRPNLSYGSLFTEVRALGEPTLENIRRAVISIRNAKLPDPSTMGNAGSFFKNPVITSQLAEDLKRQYPDIPSYPGPNEQSVKISAGWMIEKAGWKGRNRGRAAVYHNQALIIVNLGEASGTEITELANEVIADVEKLFGIRIELEVNIW